MKGYIKNARQKVEQVRAATALPATPEVSPAVDVQVDGESQPAAIEPQTTAATDAEMADSTAPPEDIAQPTTEVSNLQHLHPTNLTLEQAPNNDEVLTTDPVDGGDDSDVDFQVEDEEHTAEQMGRGEDDYQESYDQTQQTVDENGLSQGKDAQASPAKEDNYDASPNNANFESNDYTETMPSSNVQQMMQMMMNNGMNPMMSM